MLPGRRSTLHRLRHLRLRILPHRHKLAGLVLRNGANHGLRAGTAEWVLEDLLVYLFGELAAVGDEGGLKLLATLIILIQQLLILLLINLISIRHPARLRSLKQPARGRNMSCGVPRAHLRSL